jgi:hypothetical protein
MRGSIGVLSFSTSIPWRRARMAIFGSARGAECSASRRLLEQLGDPPLTVYHLDPAGDDTVRMVGFGREGSLWAGTRRGLYRWNGVSDFSPLSADSRSIASKKRRTAGQFEGVCGVGWRTHRQPSEVAQQLGIGPDQVLQVSPDRQGALLVLYRARLVSATRWVCNQYRRQRQPHL